VGPRGIFLTKRSNSRKLVGFIVLFVLGGRGTWRKVRDLAVRSFAVVTLLEHLSGQLQDEGSLHFCTISFSFNILRVS
jgi:hypothetical protein